MTIEQCVNAAKIIKPKVLFPYHYNDTPVNRISMQLAGNGIDVRIRDYK
jgi:L-ascorbate metabolism protein UlaG (beta-lactamase superfamily)